MTQDEHRRRNAWEALKDLALTILVASFALLIAVVAPASAASSDAYRSDPLTARLITAEDGVAPDAKTISAGLHIDLNGDWKTYWRSPGEVGLPPTIDWTGSENIEDAQFLWPAPTRFEAFGIENFGYKDEVVYPIQVMLERPGEPARLAGRVDLLVCETICIPESFTLELDVPAAGGIDADAAGLIATFADRVPREGDDSLRVESAAYDGEALVISIRSDAPISSPDVFPEGGSYGKPTLAVADEGRMLWASFPVIESADSDELTVTVTDGARALEAKAAVGGDPVPAPDGSKAAANEPGSILPFLLLAFVGGLILNVMPCVLPVLTIKLMSVVEARNMEPARVRRGFIASAAGVFAFVMALALATVGLRAAGVAVGWGIQFQNPVFLAFALSLVLLFAANLLGMFEIALPAGWGSRMARSGGDGYTGDFATGAFAALLATPCSAPFLGTAVAFALTGTVTDILLVFAALGTGLASPYLVVAAFPRVVRLMPRPGSWMSGLRIVLGLLLLGTALWLAWVLSGVAGPLAAIATVALTLFAVSIVSFGANAAGAFGKGAAALLLVAAMVAPAIIRTEPETIAEVSDERFIWEPFERSSIARHVSEGQVVFVDVTADWCLTCKANKAATLDREAVSSALAADDMVALQADWTRPDDDIRRYLNANGRYGIPFNIVYGPGAPDGVPLPELLTVDMVLDAIEKARGPI